MRIRRILEGDAHAERNQGFEMGEQPCGSDSLPITRQASLTKGDCVALALDVDGGTVLKSVLADMVKVYRSGKEPK